MDYDLVVIGGGAAGLGAARAAREHGVTTALISNGPLGGDCTWTGCVPSQSLIEAAAEGLDFRAAMRRVRASIDTIAATEDVEALNDEGIDVFSGQAQFISPGTLLVGKHHIGASKVVLATGSTPVLPPVPGLDAAHVHTTDSIFDLAGKPESIAVVGGGVVGCELGQALSRLGIPTTVMEASDRLLPGIEAEAGEILRRRFLGEGIEVVTGAAVEAVEHRIDRQLVTVSDGRVFEAECLLWATGRRPVTRGLDVDKAGVELTEHGYIRTDEHLATTGSGVWAAGDVTGLMPFTHAAYAMGRMATGYALTTRNRTYSTDAIPAVVYTDPEIAYVGVREDRAPDSARVAYLPLDDIDRAIVADRTDGYVKLIADRRKGLGHRGGGRLIGASIMAPHAGEMIQPVVLAMTADTFAGRLAQATAAYPSWAYGVQLAAAQLVMEIGGRTARSPGLRSD
ncbi:dihydrolipoyl dehydrogenase family protein [Haloglycomyces albus]|uniref:dihydrolipoyl dehydrogenase family protein n=1 Tax=Haloglycomyces albus TaxID=526067 RepID=UPI0004B0743A|nr:NAD(P)/FAD-dependent oxidoreductase [Haloglycomyces albus]